GAAGGAGPALAAGPGVLVGAPAAAAALARRLIAQAVDPLGRLAALAVPPDPSWAWARFADPGVGGRASLTVAPVEGGFRLTPSPAWPNPAAPVRARTGAERWMVKDAGLGLLAARAPGREPFRAVGLGAAAAERLVRLWAGATPPPAGRPVPLTAREIAAHWRGAGRLPAIGLGEDGAAVAIDLARDGPHGLVAGTSGSGKSEFLRALMLAECVTTPPDRLIIVGIDHKGGATFRDLERLPQVVGVATDLDAAGTSRVLTSLEAELAGRERLLERHGVASWGELPARSRPARLMVVVDEFRTLLDALPQAAGRLERLAAQGRSLGMGLVLATQRPAGAVSAQLRANLALRICFRVATEADSLDVIGSPEAARLDPDRPGGCILASAGRPPVRLRVRMLPPPPRRRPVEVHWPGRWLPPPAPAADPGALVAAVAQAATAVGAAPPPAPWRPPLPERLAAGESGWPGQADGVVIGWADQPEAQSQSPLTWDPAAGHLAILGPPRSGRTTAATVAAAGLAATGWVTHVYTNRPEAFADLAVLPSFGSLIPADSPARLGELLGLLGRGRVALVADAAAELEGLAAPSIGRSLIDALTQGALAPGAVLVLTAPAKPARWLSLCPHRLVLPVAEPTDALALGLPRQFVGPKRLPGRACHLGGEAPLAVQICLTPTPTELARLAARPGRPAPLEPPDKVVALPARVDDADLPPGGSDTVWVGLGGPCGAPLGLPVRPGQPIAVIGPPGSGRSTALAGIGRRLAASGHATQVFGAGAPRRWDAIADALAAGRIALVDDIESVAGPPPPAPPPRGTLIAACATATAAALRPPTHGFQAAPLGLLLGPAQRGGAAAFGPGAAAGPGLELVGAAGADPPGRGRLVAGSKSLAVQVAAGPPAPPALATPPAPPAPPVPPAPPAPAAPAAPAVPA
ncbi:MAG: hypothetical protein LBD70_06355, partial [Bifidobacteriaceae bacterium]|nr:hypothetical protein [Bifidobacteriaceae bacterium]